MVSCEGCYTPRYTEEAPTSRASSWRIFFLITPTGIRQRRHVPKKKTLSCISTTRLENCVSCCTNSFPHPSEQKMSPQTRRRDGGLGRPTSLTVHTCHDGGSLKFHGQVIFLMAGFLNALTTVGNPFVWGTDYLELVWGRFFGF